MLVAPEDTISSWRMVTAVRHRRGEVLGHGPGSPIALSNDRAEFLQLMAPVHVRRKRLRIAAPAVLQWSSRVLVSDTESSVELDPVAGHRRRPTGHRDGISPAEDIARVRDGVFFDEPDIRRRFSRFWLLLILTGVIADSTATVIRAMIVAPLMTPILVSGIVVMAVHRAWFQSSETKTNGPQPAPDSSTLRTSLDDAGLSSTTVRVELVPENVAVLSGR